MAIWHFSFSLVPREGVLRVHGEIPSKIHIKLATEVDVTPCEEDETDYWFGFNTQPAIAMVTEFLPPMESWSDEASMFGCDDGDRIEVWKDDIDGRLDCRDLSQSVLNGILSIASKMDCLIVPNQTGTIISPNMSELISAIRSSRAAAYIASPIETLIKTGKYGLKS